MDSLDGDVLAEVLAMLDLQSLGRLAISSSVLKLHIDGGEYRLRALLASFTNARRRQDLHPQDREAAEELDKLWRRLFPYTEEDAVAQNSQSKKSLETHIPSKNTYKDSQNQPREVSAENSRDSCDSPRISNEGIRSKAGQAATSRAAQSSLKGDRYTMDKVESSGGDIVLEDDAFCLSAYKDGGKYSDKMLLNTSIRENSNACEQDVCERAACEICNMAIAEDWEDAREMLSKMAYGSICANYAQALETVLHAKRMPARVNDQTGREHNILERPVLARPEVVYVLLNLAVVAGREDMAKMMLDYGLKLDCLDGRCSMDTARKCAQRGMGTLVFYVIAKAGNKHGHASVDELTFAAFSHASRANEIALSLSLARMFKARIRHEFEALNIRLRAPGFVVDANELGRRDELLAREKTWILALESELIEATRTNQVQFVQACLESDIVSPDNLKALGPELLKAAARNGNREMVLLVHKSCRVSEDALGDIFEDSVRRNFAESVKALLQFNVLHEKDYLNGLRQSAYLREANDVVAVLDPVIQRLPSTDNDDVDDNHNTTTSDDDESSDSEDIHGRAVSSMETDMGECSINAN